MISHLPFRVRNRIFQLALSATFAAAMTGCGGSSSKGSSTVVTSAGSFVETKLVADTTGVAAVTDPNLKNPWGISFAPDGPFWVSDNGTGLSTLYNGTGQITPLVVSIPAAGGGVKGKVTGQVYNSTSDFSLPGSTAATFIFDNEDGVLSGWNGGTAAVTVSDQSSRGAIYTGLAIGVNASANFLYASNFSSGEIDMFDKNFALSTSFMDSTIPTGFAAFNVAILNGLLYVTYAKQDPTKHFPVSGVGNGFVDVFKTDGTFVSRLVSAGALNSPWGLAIAPTGFGKLGGMLLVGNLGDGKINAYNPTTGAFAGTVSDSTGQAIAIDGLWALTFGNGGSGGSASTLYFTAGPNGYANGLIGSLTAS